MTSCLSLYPGGVRAGSMYQEDAEHSVAYSPYAGTMININLVRFAKKVAYSCSSIDLGSPNKTAMLSKSGRSQGTPE